MISLLLNTWAIIQSTGRAKNHILNIVYVSNEIQYLSCPLILFHTACKSIFDMTVDSDHPSSFFILKD
ncbi:hypothetical protein BH23THE1_BH23THE1_32580 [soil metagenome]